MTNNAFLTSRITALTSNVVVQLGNPNKHTIEEYKSILKNPIASAAIDLKSERASLALGEYQHKYKTIQSFIQENIENMQGSLSDVVTTLSGQASAFGFSCAEIGFCKDRRLRRTEWRLAGFNVLDPQRYWFAGKLGNLTHVKVIDRTREIWIPYKKALHVTNGGVTNYNLTSVYGNAECETAFPWVKLYNLIFQEAAVSAKTLATGILVALADSEATVILKDQWGNDVKDPMTGQPVRLDAIQNLARQLQNLENHSHIVTDKRNSISAAQIPAGEQFWSLMEAMLRRIIFISFGVPNMIFDEGSTAMGVATLSVKHSTTLDGKVEKVVKEIRSQLIEKVIRPLIIWNFGVQEDYGSFSTEATIDPNQESLMTQNLITCISTGIFDKSDLSVINKLRDLLKLPPTTAEEMQQQAQLTALLQQMQQQQIQTPNVQMNQAYSSDDDPDQQQDEYQNSQMQSMNQS